VVHWSLLAYIFSCTHICCTYIFFLHSNLSIRGRSVCILSGAPSLLARPFQYQVKSRTCRYHIKVYIWYPAGLGYRLNYLDLLIHPWLRQQEIDCRDNAHSRSRLTNGTLASYPRVGTKSICSAFVSFYDTYADLQGASRVERMGLSFNDRPFECSYVCIRPLSAGDDAIAS
jgi:hypothetical protein